MTDVHKNLASASFVKPSGIVEQTVCRTTGCLATTGCTNKYTEIFTSDNLPETCQGHGSQTICSESGKIATDYCSQYCEVKVNYFGAVIPKEQLNLWKPVGKASASRGEKITEVCTIHTKPKEEEKPKEPEKTENTTNNTNTNTNTGKDPEEPVNNTDTNTNTNTNTGVSQ